MGFFKWFFRWLRRLQKRNRRLQTNEFEAFKRFYQVENKRQGKWEFDNNYLAAYIIQTKKSPFVGDDDLNEAELFLKEQFIFRKIL